jgi:hypothetical protein
MEIQKAVHIAQSVFGAFVTCLAVYVFLNISVFTTFPVVTQFYILWTLISLVLLMYGAIQLVQGLISMFMEE